MSEADGMSTGVVEPRWKWVAKRGGQVLVLWSHGRITLHSKEGAKPSATIAKHGDWAAATDYAKRHGFELVGLIEPKEKEEAVTVAAANGAAEPKEATVADGARRRSNGSVSPAKRGELAPETIERHTLVEAVIATGVRPGAAIKQVAADLGVEWGTVHGSYYQVRKKQGGVAPKVRVERRYKAMYEQLEAGRSFEEVTDAAAAREGLNRHSFRGHFKRWLEKQPPVKVKPASSRQEQPLTHQPHASAHVSEPAPANREAAEGVVEAARQVSPAAERVRQLRAVEPAQPSGVTAVEDEDDPIRLADRLAAQRRQSFEAEYRAIKAAHAQLEAEVDGILARMGGLEEREEQLRKAAAFFGMEFKPIVPEAT